MFKLLLAVLFSSLVVFQSTISPAFANDKESKKKTSPSKKRTVKGNSILIEAKSLFDKYKESYQKYNFAGYDRFYSDSLRAYITAGNKTKAIDGKTWRALSKKTITQLRSRGIKSQFSDPLYTSKGKYVRARFNVRTLHELDTIDWLMKKEKGGSLKIVEERQKVTITR